MLGANPQRLDLVVVARSVDVVWDQLHQREQRDCTSKVTKSRATYPGRTLELSDKTLASTLPHNLFLLSPRWNHNHYLA